MTAGLARLSMPAILLIIGIVLAVVLVVLIVLLVVFNSRNKKIDMNQMNPYGGPPVPELGPRPANPPAPRQIPEPVPFKDPVPVAPAQGGNGTVILNNQGSSTAMTCLMTLSEINGGPSFMAELSEGGVSVIGRTAGTCNIVLLNDSSVSSRHCQFERQGMGIYLADLGSTNGTYLNEIQVVSRVQVTEGSVVEIGRSKYKVSFDWR